MATDTNFDNILAGQSSCGCVIIEWMLSEWSGNKTWCDSLLQYFCFRLVWCVPSGRQALRHSHTDNCLHVCLLELMCFWIAEQNILFDSIKYFYKVRNDLWNIYSHLHMNHSHNHFLFASKANSYFSLLGFFKAHCLFIVQDKSPLTIKTGERWKEQEN